MTPAIVLGDGITALTAARSLGRLSVPVYLLGPHKNDIACYSRYVKVIECPDALTPQSFVTQIRKTAESSGSKPVVLCASDKFLQLLSSNRDQLTDVATFMLPSRDVVDTVIDKGLFGDFCVANNLSAPRSWALETTQQFEECLERITYPVLIKPTISHNARKENFQKDGAYAVMILIESRSQLEKNYSELRSRGVNLLIQEYIVGPDCEHYSYVSYRNSESRELAAVGYRKIRLSPIHGGAGTFIEMSDSVELVAKSKIILDKLNYSGISSVCFKRHQTTGELMVHEINGRLPMGHSASLLCNINFPYVAHQDAIGESVDVQSRSPGDRKWIALNKDFDSFRKYRHAGELSTMQWLLSLRKVRVCAEFGWDDLRPFIFLLMSMTRRAIKRLSNQ